MKKYTGTLIKFILSVGLGVLIVWFTFNQLDQEERMTMRAAFSRANYWWLLAGGVVNLLSNYFRTQRWRMLLQPLGYRPGFFITFCSIIVMYFANLLFPRLGEILRCGILSRYEKIPINKSVGTMITERLVDILALPVMMGLLLMTQRELFYQTLERTKQITSRFSHSAAYDYIIIVVAAIVAGGIIYKSATDRYWWNKAFHFLRGALAGFRSIFKTGRPALFLFHSVNIWLCYWAAAYISFFSLKETAGVSPWAGLGAVFFGAFAYTAVQGGVGAYPLVLQMLLLVYGIDPVVGLSAGWLIWTVQTSLIVLAGTTLMLALLLLNRPLSKPTS